MLVIFDSVRSDKDRIDERDRWQPPRGGVGVVVADQDDVAGSVVSDVREDIGERDLRVVDLPAYVAGARRVENRGLVDPVGPGKAVGELAERWPGGRQEA